MMSEHEGNCNLMGTSKLCFTLSLQSQLLAYSHFCCQPYHRAVYTLLFQGLKESKNIYYAVQCVI